MLTSLTGSAPARVSRSGSVRAGLLTVGVAAVGASAAMCPAGDREVQAVTVTGAVMNPAGWAGGRCRALVRADAYLPPELQRLMATAAAVIDRHTNDAGRCQACAQQWPCPSAQQADLTLGGF